MLYVTTDKFLRVFGLNSLDELPQTEALSVSAQAQKEAERDDGQTEMELDGIDQPEPDAPISDTPSDGTTEGGVIA